MAPYANMSSSPTGCCAVQWKGGGPTSRDRLNSSENYLLLGFLLAMPSQKTTMKIFVMQKKMGGETSRWLYVLGSRMSFFSRSVKMSRRHNVWVAKCLGDTMSWWQNVSPAKCQGVKMSLRQNVKVSKCWGVKSGSSAKCPVPKCRRTNTETLA